MLLRVLNHLLSQSGSLDAIRAKTMFRSKSFSAISATLISVPFAVSGAQCPLSIQLQTVTIGALIPITGVSSSLGESEGAALKVATKDINEYLFKTHSGIGIKLVIEDTQSNPSVSLEKLKQQAQQSKE